MPPLPPRNILIVQWQLAKFPSTTMWFSNVPGPQEPISIFGNQVAFIASSLYGQPVVIACLNEFEFDWWLEFSNDWEIDLLLQALTIHIVSYVNKMSMVISVDENIIADPHQLCDDLEEALKLIKNYVIGQDLIDN